jgi:glycosyltransferase involved in cell wall biosynthesis
MSALRLTVVATHPVQYHAPWYRYIAQRCADLALTVVYAIEPTPAQQGADFTRSFHWDTPLRDGYCNVVVRPTGGDDDILAHRFTGLDVPEIGRAVIETRPDVVLAAGWNSITLVRAIVACRMRGIPVLYRGESWWQPPASRRAAFARAARTSLLLRMFDGWLSIGARARAYLERFRLDTRRIFDSPYCIDNEFFAAQAAPYQTPAVRSEVRQTLGVEGDAFAALFVGKLIAIKRVGDLIEAAARVGRSVRVLIAGSGAEERVQRERSRALGIEASWLGFVNQSQLGRLYAAADCLVLPSQHETWGLVVNEALATGLPCLVSDGVGCAPDLVTDATGGHFPVGDIEALAASLAELVAQRRAGRDCGQACRTQLAKYSFADATAGLLAGCRAVAR